jgi:hypothetical protein
MAKVVKVIELMSQSPKSWEDAAQGAVSEETKPCGISARFTSRNLLLKWMAEKSPTIASTQKSPLIWSAGNRFATLSH